VISNWLQGYASESISIGLISEPFVTILIIALLTVSFQSIKAAIANPVNLYEQSEETTKG
jgi:putative ABC transport system permease protein